MLKISQSSHFPHIRQVWNTSPLSKITEFGKLRLLSHETARNPDGANGFLPLVPISLHGSPAKTPT